MTVRHTCHWPGCQVEVKPRLWGCRDHWFVLPKRLRDAIWESYVPGQEITKTPSEAYIKAARDVQRWIEKRGA
jgi:hypothetical protein